MGRQPNIPHHYLMEEIADEYAEVFRKEFDLPIDIMGTSTGGQIIQFLGANHPDVVKNLIIISASYRLSEPGVEIERRSAEYFAKGQYGRSLAAIMDFMSYHKILMFFMKFMVLLVGRFVIGKVEYPEDFQVEVRADREMNFKDKLGEINVPTLLISGENDVGYLADDLRVMAEEIPNATLKLYPKYGHELSAAKSKEIMKQIKDFLGI